MERVDSVTERFDGDGPTLPEGWKVLDGNWSIEAGKLAGTAGGEARLRLPGGPWRDFELRLDLARPANATAPASFGVEISGQAGSHRLSFDRDSRGRSRAVYAAGSDGAYRSRGRSEPGTCLAMDKVRTFRVQCAGGRVRMWCDDDLVFHSTLARDMTEGDLVLRLKSGAVSIDAVEVRPLTESEAAAVRVVYGPFRRVPIIAHRGASADAPENTLAALRLAVSQGAPAVEFDVHRTRDGTLVLLHDHDLERTTDFEKVFPGRDASVTAVDFAEMARLDAGSWKSARYRGEPLPTFLQALEALRGKSTPVVEIKPETIGRHVAEVIEESGMAGEVFVQSFSSQALRDFHEALPGVTTGFLTGKRISEDGLQRARAHLREARETGTSAVVCHFSLVDSEYVHELHRHAMTLWVYTVDDPVVFETLVRLGVDGIITNVPALFLEMQSR